MRWNNVKSCVWPPEVSSDPVIVRVPAPQNHRAELSRLPPGWDPHTPVWSTEHFTQSLKSASRAVGIAQPVSHLGGSGQPQLIILHPSSEQSADAESSGPSREKVTRRSCMRCLALSGLLSLEMPSLYSSRKLELEHICGMRGVPQSYQSRSKWPTRYFRVFLRAAWRQRLTEPNGHLTVPVTAVVGGCRDWGRNASSLFSISAVLPLG